MDDHHLVTKERLFLTFKWPDADRSNRDPISFSVL